MPRRRFTGKTRRKTRSGRGTAVRALRLARKAWQATDHEVKFQDITLNAINFVQPTEELFRLANGLTEGVSQNNRIGEEVRLVSIRFNLCMAKSVLAVPITSTRFLLVWDKQPNGTLATVANVLENIGTGDAVTDLVSQRNYQTSKRFSILMDRFVVLNDGHNAGVHRTYRRRLNKKVKYNGAAGTISNINTGALIFVFMSDQAIAGEPPLISAQVRLSFVG